MSLISVARKDLVLGTPLPWAVHDQDGRILMQAGEVLESEAQLAALLTSRPMRELSWNAGTVTKPAVPDPVDDGLEAALREDTGESTFTFQDMKLRVGDRIQLQFPAAISQERHVVKLIGYLNNASLLVTMPIVNGLRLPIREQNKVVARIFSSQKAFGFSSMVERVCKIPYDYLHLSFPEHIQGSVVRKSPRVRTRLIVSIAKVDTAEGAARQPGIISNISADGALIKVRQPLFRNGEHIQLSFRVNLHKVDAYLTIKAVIRSTFEDEEKDASNPMMLNHGVQFVDLPPNDSVILQSLIYQQMIEDPQSLA